MDRRRYLILAAGAAGLTGCSGETTSTATASDTPTSSPTSTATEAPTPTTEFRPAIYFETCGNVLVDATSYDRVTLYFENDLETFGEGYTGANSFAGTGDREGEPIWEVGVTKGSQDFARENPQLSACLATPTPTETEVETPTKTVEPTETPTETASPTPTPPQDPEMEISSNAWLENRGEPDETYYLRAKVTNPYDRPYRVSLGASAYFSDTDGVGLGSNRKNPFNPGETWRPLWSYERDDASEIQRHEITQTVDET